MEIQTSFRCIAFADDLLPMCKKKQEDMPPSAHPLCLLISFSLLLNQLLVKYAIFAFNSYDVNALTDCIQIDLNFILLRCNF